MRMDVDLRPSEREALIKLARLERRDPRDQAAVIIRDALIARGYLPPLTTPYTEQPPFQPEDDKA